MADKTKILIIEDDIDLVEAMKVALDGKKYKVSAAYDPDEGFRKAKKEQPDLIILDVMFDTDKNTRGFDLAVKIRQTAELKAIPILMSTAVNGKKDGFHFSMEEDGPYNPVDAFLEKPAKPAVLVETVEALLAKGESKWVNYPEMREKVV